MGNVFSRRSALQEMWAKPLEKPKFRLSALQCAQTIISDVAKAKAKALGCKTKAKDLSFKAKANNFGLKAEAKSTAEAYRLTSSDLKFHEIFGVKYFTKYFLNISKNSQCRLYSSLQQSK